MSFIIIKLPSSPLLFSSLLFSPLLFSPLLSPPLLSSYSILFFLLLCVEEIDLSCPTISSSFILTLIILCDFSNLTLSYSFFTFFLPFYCSYLVLTTVSRSSLMKCMGDILQYRKQSKFPALWGGMLELWEQAARVYSRKVQNLLCIHVEVVFSTTLVSFIRKKRMWTNSFQR